VLIEASAGPLRQGDSGPLVTAVRQLLNRLGWPCSDGAEVFDEGLDRAVRAFQQRRGLIADGVVGAQTARALDASRWSLGDRVLLFTPGHLMRGDDVAELQERMLVLGVHAHRVDGSFGPDTDASLRELQRGLGLRPDGICGPATIRALGSLSRAVGGGDAYALRQQAGVAVAGKSLAAVADPGRPDPAPPAPGRLPAGELAEAEVAYDLARRIEGRLAATGVTAVLTRGPHGRPDPSDRAGLAKDVGADMLVSLACDSHPTPDATGVATFYWSDERVGGRSPIGFELATLIQREIVARTGLVDCRTHPSTIDILKLTPMPAVQVMLGYLTNPDDAARLADPRFRDVVAEAVVVAIQRVYLAEDEAKTGALNLRDVLARAGKL
jgi:N-acetylmuramoyl-L-alanine amidase